jgi:hypothetical protein
VIFISQTGMKSFSYNAFILVGVIFLHLIIDCPAYFVNPSIQRNQLRLFSESKFKGFGKKSEKVVEAVKTNSKEEQPLPNNSVVDSDESSEDVELPTKLESTETSLDDVIKKTPMMIKARKQKLRVLESKVSQLREEEQLLSSDPSVGAVPEIVANRMIQRITFFFGIPTFGGLLIFAAAVISSKYYDVVVPPGLIAYATQAPFVLALVGISYAILSSSWDDEPGSLLGFKEFKINVDRIREGLNRSRNTEKLKDEIEQEVNSL